MPEVHPYPNDPVNPGILETAGADVLYRQASGFEKALADVDAQRLTAIYAELISEQWDPYKISARNLSYLAWAVGVNLWEKDWDQTFRRWWVANQWELKAQRGSLIGTERFVRAVSAEVKRAIVPPALAYGLRKDSDSYIDFTAQPKVGDTITIGADHITFRASGAHNNESNIGTDIIDTLENLQKVLGSGTGDVRKLTGSYAGRQNQGYRFTITRKDQSLKISTNVVGATVSLSGERQAYVARFPQLRMYPFVAREKLRWLCYVAPNFHNQAARSWMRFDGLIPPNGSTIVLNGTIITFVTGTPTGLQVQIGVDLPTTLTNLMTLLTTSIDPQIASNDYVLVPATSTIAIIHKTPGRAGNAFTLRGTAPVVFMRGMSTLLDGRDGHGNHQFFPNGSFVGQHDFPEGGPWPNTMMGYGGLFPTVQNQGGKYTRTATLWDRGVETPLTMRKIVRVHTGADAGWGFTPGVSAYDEEVVLPSRARLSFLEGGHYLNGHTKRRGIFPNVRPKLRTITIARSGKLDLVEGKAQYQTVSPSNDLLNLRPEEVATIHPIRRTELYASRGQYLAGKFAPPSNAWQFLYERWYLFDPDRVPDRRRTGIYMNNARLGIPKFTAELMIKIRTKHPRFMSQTNGYLYGFFKRRDDEPINKVRRAVTASMALRDTVLINTRTVRRVQVGDIIDASGRYQIGQLVPA